MPGEIPTGQILENYYAENQSALGRQRNVVEVFKTINEKYPIIGKTERENVSSVFNRMVAQVSPSEEEIPLKWEAANNLRAQLEDDKTLDAFLAIKVNKGLEDLEAGRKTTSEALQVLNLTRGLIGLKLLVVKESKELFGRGGPPMMEADREMELRDWRLKYEEPVQWRGRDYEPKLMRKICNVLLTTGVDGGDINGFLRLMKDRQSQYGSFGDFAGAIAHLVGDERKGGPMQAILGVGARSGMDIKGLEGAIGSLTPGDIVAFANLTWTLKINGTIRSISVGSALETLLTLEGRRAWTDPFWTGARHGADPFITKLLEDEKALKDAHTGMQLEPGFLIYPDGFPRRAGVMDKGHTNIEDIPENERIDKLPQVLMDGSPALQLYLAARALGILTQPISRLYGAMGIMEALPPIQKMWGTLYEKYYTNQHPFYRLRAFVSLMSMTDRAVKSPLSTIYPLSDKRETMDGFAFMEKREQAIARGGIKLDEDSIKAEIEAEHTSRGETIEGQELKFEMNERMNKIDVLLVNIFGCQIDDPASFEQEFAVARIVGAMNDKLITPTCEEMDNPITDMNVRRRIALARAREYFRNQVNLAFSYTDKRSHSMEPLFNYVKFVHAPPEMIMHRLNLLPDEFKPLLNHVDFTGLLKRWKGEVDDQDPANNRGLEAAKRTVTAMGGGVLATLPGGTADLNTPFDQKQGGYWSNEYEMYKQYTKGYPLSLQVMDDEAQKRAGVKVESKIDNEERAYELINELASAFRGINSNDKIRGTAIEGYLKWLEETAPQLTFIGGKPPVVTFFHIAATVAASFVGKRFVPPYMDKEKMCYLIADKETGRRLHVPLGVNDAPAEYGDYYSNLPEDILALVGVEKEHTAKGLISPGRISSIPVIGMNLGEITLDDGHNKTTCKVYREANEVTNPGEYAGSKKIFPGKPDDAYAVMLETTFDKLCDLALLDPGERSAAFKGMTVLPDKKYLKHE